MSHLRCLLRLLGVFDPLEFSCRIVDFLRRLVIGKEKDETRSCRSDTRAWQSILGRVKHLMQDILLALTAHDECDAVCVVDDRISERDTLARWLWRIIKPCDPTVGFTQQLVTREKRTRMSIRSHTEQDQIKHGESCRVHLCKSTDELLFVSVRKLVHVIEQRLVDRVDLLAWDRDVRQERIVAGFKVGVFVVERDGAFVAEEDLPEQKGRERGKGNA